MRPSSYDLLMLCRCCKMGMETSKGEAAVCSVLYIQDEVFFFFFFFIRCPLLAAIFFFEGFGRVFFLLGGNLQALISQPRNQLGVGLQESLSTLLEPRGEGPRDSTLLII